MKDEFTNEFLEWARTHLTDVSAIGLNILIDHIDESHARIAQLTAEIARRDEKLALTEKKLCNIDRSARAEIARRDEKLKITDGLLKEATETIGAVIACCTYNSNDDAKIGIYGIDQKAFTMIDQFITHYNDAVFAGKVSVDVKRELSDAGINELGAQEAEKRGEK